MKNICSSFLLTGIAGCMAVFALLTGCDKMAGLPEKPELEASVSELLFPISGGEQTIVFETNRDWTASIDPTSVSPDVSWCTISADKGGSGKNSLTVVVDGMDGDYREAVLILNASAAGQEIRIMQTGKPIITTDAPSEIMESTALLSMTWQYAGDIAVTEFGFSVKKSAETGFTDYPVEAEAVPGTYTLRVSGLEASAGYTVKAYVQTTEKRYEGAEQSFTTAAAPENVSIAAVKAAGRQVAQGGISAYAENHIITGTVVASYVEPVVEETPGEDGAEAKASAATKSVSVEETKVAIVDGTEKDCGITLYLEAGTNSYAVGDKISVRVKDAQVSHTSSGAVYLTPLTSGITLVSNNNQVAPVTINHAELADYESMYVTIENTQLLESFEGLETWSSAEVLTFEVDGSDVSYNACVPAASEIASQAPVFESGSISGIVVSDDVSSCLVMLDSADDVAGLNEDRFASLLTLRFLAPVFSGDLYVGEEIEDALVRIPYENGDNSIIDGPISVTVSGDAADGIEVAALESAMIAAGSGYIDFVVSGTPTMEGEVTFTVVGMPDLEMVTCTATVGQPYVPEVGNFKTYWNFSGHSYAVTIPYADNTNPDITVSALNFMGDAENISATRKKDDWAAQGWDVNTSETNPEQYFYFDLTVASGKTLLLTGSNIGFFLNGGDADIYIQYSINGAAYKNAFTTTLTADSETEFVLPLGTIADLASVASGSKVTFRIFAISANAKTKVGMKKGDDSFSIYGNVE